MSTIDKHAPGEFGWIELGTTDQRGAKAFYTALFGWEFRDSPIGPNEYYTMFTLEGRSSAGCFTLQPELTKKEIPAHWGVYVSVASASDTTELARAHEATVFCGPFDVAAHGRMSTMADPAGAVFSIWEAKDHAGIGVSHQHGSFCWADLATADPAKAAAFYQAVFGWEMRAGDEGYLHISNAGEYIGGIPPASRRRPHEPPHWLVYFQVDDCAAATAKAVSLGADVFSGPMTIERVGHITVLADPQGAVFSLFQPFPHS